MSYHAFKCSDNTEYGSFEVFYAARGGLPCGENGEESETGWYWWGCFPGCIPDGDPMGPFDTESEAIEDARNFD